MALATPDRSNPPVGEGFGARFRPNFAWAGLVVVNFVVATAIAYRPTFDTLGDTVLAVTPWLLIGAALAVFVDLVAPLRMAALAVAVGGWGILIFNDDRWSLMSFAIYVLCFTFKIDSPGVGVVLSAVVTAIWTAAWVVTESPAWTLILPASTFAVGSVLSVALHRTVRMAREQAALVRKLEATREELAESERSRGVLEERTRLAGEIHDTLAQGFTSIVLLARGGTRSAEPGEALASIETAAEKYLAEARRIVRAAQPHELEGASLHQALEREVAASLPPAVRGRFRVVGTPLVLTGDIEVTLLRATQEALRNIRAHAKATEVEVTLSYLDDTVALDVRDDGIGFAPGEVSDRGSLTGGQGLHNLSQRAKLLAGHLTIESGEARGSVLSLLLPVGRP